MDIAKNNDDDNETDGDKSYVGEADDRIDSSDDDKDPRSRKKMIIIMMIMMMIMMMIASPWLETSTWW